MYENEHTRSKHFFSQLAKPVQYNGGQCDIPTWISLDWLELYCEYAKAPVSLEKCNFNGYDFVLENFGTKHYANRYTILWGGVVAGHLLSHPRSTVLPPGAFALRVVNEILYCYTIEQVNAIISDILHKIGANCINVTRIDIAIDAPERAYNYTPRSLHHNLQSGELRTKNRLTQLTAYDKKIDGKFVTVQCTIGSRTSDMVAKFYNKTLELSESKKHHIQNVHEYVFKDYADDIYRFEVTLSGAFIDTVRKREKQSKDGYILGQLLKTDKIRELFKSIVVQKYTLGQGPSGERWDRLEKKYIINMQVVGAGVIDGNMDIRAICAENTTGIYSDRIAAKNITIRCLTGNGGPDEFSTLLKILSYKPVRDVFERRIFYWKTEAEKGVEYIPDEYVGEFLRNVLEQVA